MKNSVRLAVLLTAIAALAGGAGAQNWDTDGPNATLTLNGITPSAEDPTGHLVLTPVPGDFELVVDSGANATQGVILISGPLNDNAFPLTGLWGGSIDVGNTNPVPPFIPLNLAVIADGVSNSTGSQLDLFAVTPFTLGVWLGIGEAGNQSPGLQAVVSDPTVGGPFPFDNTEAGAGDFQALVIDVFDSAPDDGSITVFLEQNAFASPITVSMGATAYTRLYVGTNGQITFFAPSADFTPTMNEFFNGFWPSTTILPNPAVAVAWQDMGRTSVTTDDITIIQDGISGEVEVQYNNQEHWDSQLASGTMTVRFNTSGPGTMTFDHTGFIYGDPTLDAGPIIGVTDGNDSVGTDRTADLSADIAAMYTSGGTESIGEDFNASAVIGGALDIGVWNAADLGSNFTWMLN